MATLKDTVKSVSRRRWVASFILVGVCIAATFLIITYFFPGDNFLDRLEASYRFLWEHTIVQETVEVPAEMLPTGVQAYALKVKGNSMIDALVAEGDIVILESINTANDADMLVAWLIERREATLKKLYRESKRIRLQPANQTMSPIFVDPDKVQVQGRVIAVLRKYSGGRN